MFHEDSRLTVCKPRPSSAALAADMHLAAPVLSFTKTVITAMLVAPARRLACCEFRNHHDVA